MERKAKGRTSYKSGWKYLQKSRKKENEDVKRKLSGMDIRGGKSEEHAAYLMSKWNSTFRNPKGKSRGIKSGKKRLGGRAAAHG